MASWNELFADEKYREMIPETAVYRFCSMVEGAFDERPLKLWDLGCGAGRHTMALAWLGHDVYATDAAPRAVDLTKQRLAELDLSAEVRLADMMHCPWQPSNFHGAVSWNVLHHNRIAAIREAVSHIYESLIPGGMLMVTLKSDKADFAGQGTEIEPGTFIHDIGDKSGVPHHYFNEVGIRDLFSGWKFMVLAEQVIAHLERPDRFWEYTPFPFTNWRDCCEKAFEIGVFECWVERVE